MRVKDWMQIDIEVENRTESTTLIMKTPTQFHTGKCWIDMTLSIMFNLLIDVETIEFLKELGIEKPPIDFMPAFLELIKRYEVL